MTKNPIFIFNSKDELLAITTNYSEALYEESIGNKGATLEIIFPANEEHAEHLVGGNQVAFKDLEDRFRLFTIRETDDEDGASFEKVVNCLPAINELMDAIIENQIPQDKDAAFVINNLLAGTRWLTGNIAALGLNSTSFYYLDVLESLLQTASIWGGELIDRIELDDTGISGRYIDLVFRRGADKGKRFEIDKDIESITRTSLYYPKTALYGRGSSIEVGEGNSRRITFEDVVWSIANGDPVDKPAGQKWVGDPDALLIHGIGKDGEKLHRFGQFDDNDEEVTLELLKKTWMQLQVEKMPKVRYKMTVNTFYGIAGYEHEQVLLGDTGAIIDNNLKPPILVESRVISLKYDIGDPASGEVVIGNFLDFNEDQSKLDWVIEKVSEDSGYWDSLPPPIEDISDTSFPDTAPPVPTNIEVNGLFRLIQMRWDYEASSFIGAYEVYGSQIPSFIPDPSNLLFRGKTGGFVHNADTNQMWYYRFRSVNTHGTASAYSLEFSGQTANINLGEVAPGVITEIELADNAISSIKVQQNAIETIHINQFAITEDKIVANAITSDKIFANAITAMKIAANAITADKIEANAVTADKINANAITAIKIAANAITTSKIEALAITAEKIDVNAITAMKIAANAIVAAKIEAGAVIAEKIAVGAVTADKILAASITSDKIVVAGLDAAVIKFGTMSGSRIQAYSITADRLNVSSLDAITGNIGFLTSGTIDVSQAGITSAGALASSTRFWAGASYGTKDFAPFRVRQDGAVYASNLNITGGSINVTTDVYVGRTLYVGYGTSGSSGGVSVGSGLSLDTDGWNATVAALQYLRLEGTNGVDVYTQPSYGLKFANVQATNDKYLEVRSSSGSYTDIDAIGRRLSLKGNSGHAELFSSSINETMIRGYNNGSPSSILKFSSTGFQIRNNADNSFASISASAFVVNSGRQSKRAIISYEDDALQEVLTTPVHRYHLTEDTDKELKRVGLVYDEAPADIVDINGYGVDIYGMASLLWRAVQQLDEKVKLLEEGGIVNENRIQ